MKFSLSLGPYLFLLTTAGCSSMAPPSPLDSKPVGQTAPDRRPTSIGGPSGLEAGPASPALKCWFDRSGAKTTPNGAKPLDGHGGATTLITRNSAAGVERCQATYLDRKEGRDSTLQLMGSVRDGPTASSVMITPGERSGHGIDSVLTMAEGLLCSCRVE